MRAIERARDIKINDFVYIAFQWIAGLWGGENKWKIVCYQQWLSKIAVVLDLYGKFYECGSDIHVDTSEMWTFRVDKVEKALWQL